MKKLSLKNFKAFEQEITISLENEKNLLLYGENGAGKSSIYEAIRIIFFKNRIEAGLTANTPEDLIQLKSETWAAYNNKINNHDFEIMIDDEDHSTFVNNSYQVFMISIEEMKIEDKIDLQTLLSSFCFPIEDVSAFCAAEFQSIQDHVNATLLSFKESITIEIDEQDDFVVKIIDSKKNIEKKTDIKKYFNEAKLNLIILLVLLNSVLKIKDAAKKTMLVLDDFITSLDASNRTFLIQYIFENFSDTQKLIFSHNISFYNLIMHVVNNVFRIRSHWEFANLFEINNVHRLYVKSEIERVKDIQSAFDALAMPNDPLNIESIGNRIRKKFEILLYEYSKLVMVGAVEESKEILAKISSGEGTYFYRKHTPSDLLNKMQDILSENNPNNLSGRLQSEIDKYKYQPFQNFQKILNELKLYQKVTMHPMSHGAFGMNDFTVKEIEKSLELLDKMETYIKDLVDSNVATV